MKKATDTMSRHMPRFLQWAMTASFVGGAMLLSGSVGAQQGSAAAQPAAQEFDNVADGEKARRTQDALSRMRATLAKVLQHLEEAREERDVVKLNCVNEKLTAIKGLLKISEQADVSMQEALARRNSEAAQHEFEKISIAGRKTDQLLSESEACVGELAVYSGDTEVELVIDGVSENDPSEQDASVEVIIRPPAASPFQ